MRDPGKEAVCRHHLDLWSGKTNCAAFCASTALIAGSGNNTVCNATAGVERMGNDNEVRKDVVRLICLYLGKHGFLGHFTVTKT